MKAVVTQIQNGLAAVLLEDGRMKKIGDDHFSIGQVIEIQKRTKKKLAAIWIAAAAAVVLVAMGSTAVWAERAPYSYVSLDVNPSIEFTLNRFDRVLEANAVNADGAEILRAIDLENIRDKTIDEAISAAVRQIQAEGYLEDENSGIVIATSTDDLKKASALANRLKEDAEDCAGKHVTVEAQGVGKQRVEEARKLGTTPGKLNLVQKLQASTDDPDSYDTQTWLNKPVKEIMKELKANKKAAKSNQTDKAGKADKSQKAQQKDPATATQTAAQPTTETTSPGNAAPESTPTTKNTKNAKNTQRTKNTTIPSAQKTGSKAGSGTKSTTSRSETTVTSAPCEEDTSSTKDDR